MDGTGLEVRQGGRRGRWKGHSGGEGELSTVGSHESVVVEFMSHCLQVIHTSLGASTISSCRRIYRPRSTPGRTPPPLRYHPVHPLPYHLVQPPPPPPVPLHRVTYPAGAPGPAKQAEKGGQKMLGAGQAGVFIIARRRSCSNSSTPCRRAKNKVTLTVTLSRHSPSHSAVTAQSQSNLPPSTVDSPHSVTVTLSRHTRGLQEQ